VALLANGHHAKPFKTFSEWAKTHGEVFTVNLGSSKAVVLNSIEAAKEALILKGHAVSGRPDLKTRKLA
jgi:cytochrome P450 family 307 subfamily A